MAQKYKLHHFFCREFPVDCTFEMKSYQIGATMQNEDTKTTSSFAIPDMLELPARFSMMKYYVMGK